MTIKRFSLFLAAALTLGLLAGCQAANDTSLAIRPFSGLVYGDSTANTSEASLGTVQGFRFGSFRYDNDTDKNLTRGSTPQEWPKGCTPATDGSLVDSKNVACQVTGGELSGMSAPEYSKTSFFALEAYGPLSVYSTDFCSESVSCSPGWTCDSTKRMTADRKNCLKYIPGRGDVTLSCSEAAKLAFCRRDIKGAVKARGLSDGIIYTGSSAVSVPLYFTRVLEPVLLAASDGGLSTLEAPVPSSSAQQRTEGLFGHEAFVLPDGKVALIGGSTTYAVKLDKRLHPYRGQLFDPSDNTYSLLKINPWTSVDDGRADFSLTPIEEPVTVLPTGTAEDEVKATKHTDGDLFLMVGGRQTTVTDSATQTESTSKVFSNIYIGRYDSATPAIALEDVATSAFTARWGHSTTYLGNGKFIVAGGMTNGGSASSDIYFINIYATSASARVVKVSATLTAPRYGHTATLLWSHDGTDIVPMIVIVGGEDESGGTVNYSHAVNFITVGSDGTISVSEPDATSTDYDLSMLARAGHIALPVQKLNTDGYLPEANIDTSIVLIYGGYSSPADGSTKVESFNLSSPSATANVSINLPSISSKKVVVTNSKAWSRNQGYYAAMYPSTSNQMPFPCINSKWVWMDSSHTRVLVVGGKLQSGSGSSAWAEVLSLSTGDSPFTSYTFGPNEEDTVQTPFRVGVMQEGRQRMSLVHMPNGLYLISGGLTLNTKTAKYKLSTTSETINSPNVTNVWGNIFDALPFGD